MKSFRNYLITTTLLLSFFSILIVNNHQMAYPIEVGPKFDERIRPLYINILNEEQPEMFFIGDSMLGAAVNEDIVAKALDKKIQMSSLPGTASTIWYLIIKNNIVLAEHRPEHMVIFFRDSMMTVPGYRVTGRYFELIDEFASSADTLLIERSYLNQMTSLEKLMETYMPIYSTRWTIRESIDRHLRYSLGSILLECDQICMDYSMEYVFEQDNLDLTFLSEAINTADNYLYTEHVLDFEDQINKSFLPEIIRLCQENDIRLILVRMPILRFEFENEGMDPPELDGYIRDLSMYLQENNVPFLDFEPRDMPPEYFTDAIHLNEKGKALFTQELVEALKPIIK